MGAVQAARFHGDEIAEISADALLHGAASAQACRDFGIDLVPRAADLALKIAAEGAEIFIEFPPLVAG